MDKHLLKAVALFALLPALALSGCVAGEPEETLETVSLQDEPGKEDSLLGSAVVFTVTRNERISESLAQQGSVEVTARAKKSAAMRGTMYILPRTRNQGIDLSIESVDPDWVTPTIGFLVYFRLPGGTEWTPFSLPLEITSGYGLTKSNITLNYFSALNIIGNSMGFVAPRVGRQSVDVDVLEDPIEIGIAPIPTASDWWWNDLLGSYDYRVNIVCHGGCK